MSNHTPGPWHYGQNKKFGSVGKSARLVPRQGWFIGPETGFDIAEVHLTASQSAEEQEANAKLLAASPELLEAASWVCKLFGTNHPTGIKELKQYIRQLREAVKKATE